MKRFLLRFISALLLVSLFLTGRGARPAYAAGYTVNSTADNTTAGDSLCTLREAIQSANNAGNGDCGPNSPADDTITFSVSGTITLGSTLPAIVSGAGTLTIDGDVNGDGIGDITISGNNSVQVMTVNSGANLTLQNITIANGKNNAGPGGGVYNSGTLTISNSAFSQNWTWSNGGGVYNGGTLTITNSTFSGNFSNGGGGGGVFNAGGATLTIANSTFNSNQVGNTSGGSYGAGVYNSGTLTITNSTFNNNYVLNAGGGVYNAGTATLKNTIIANSTNGDCYGTLTSASINNLIEGNGYACGLTNGVNGNIIGVDPNLGTLTGSPAYYPLNPGSPAIDAGDDATCAAAPVSNQSQNGVTRPQGAHCDIGSYEAVLPDLTATKSNSVSGTVILGNSFTWTVTVANSSSAAANFTSGQTILQDNLPSGATYGTPTVQNISNVTGTIACTISTGVLTCTASGGSVTLGAPSSSFQVAFSVTPAATGTLTNPASSGICRADPNSVITESSESNNDCAANTVTVTPSDTTPPAVLSIVRQSPSGQVVTSGNQVTFRVTFSENVSGVDTGDFQLTLLSVPGVNASISGITGSGNVYDVTVDITGLRNTANKRDGAIRLDVPTTASIQDLAGNSLSGLPYTDGQIYSIVQEQTFPDAASSHWAWTYIERLFYMGIAVGYPDGTYRPDNPVTRAEMAAFLMKAKNGSSYTPPNVSPTFSDTAGHWAEDWIEALKAADITSGYPDGTYRPEDPVTRAQMAVFLLKAVNGSSYTPPNVSPTFSDTAGHWAEDWIEALKAAGIISGYPDGTYRPENPVTRAEMAVFLVKTFNLP